MMGPASSDEGAAIAKQSVRRRWRVGVLDQERRSWMYGMEMLEEEEKRKKVKTLTPPAPDQPVFPESEFWTLLAVRFGV